MVGLFHGRCFVLQSLWLWSRGVVGSTSKGPNVVVVMADDADLLPGSVESMPYVSGVLAARGVTVERFYANTPLCSPSRATLLTGAYFHNHRVASFGECSEPGAGVMCVDLKARGGFLTRTLAVPLAAAGYANGFFGKWLNGDGIAALCPPKNAKAGAAEAKRPLASLSFGSSLGLLTFV